MNEAHESRGSQVVDKAEGQPPLHDDIANGLVRNIKSAFSISPGLNATTCCCGVDGNTKLSIAVLIDGASVRSNKLCRAVDSNPLDQQVHYNVKSWKISS